LTTAISQPKPAGAAPLLLGMNGYQWTVILAAWLRWGFDIFDGLVPLAGLLVIPFMIETRDGVLID
jgi:hypothetical protein